MISKFKNKDMNYCKIMLVALVLALPMLSYADEADPADHATWQVTPNNYAYDMTLTTVLYFDIDESTDPNDKIAAFCETDCRGVEYARTIVEGRYLAYLRIYGNNSSGDTITLYMYDASEDEIVEVTQKLSFVPQANYGTQSIPYVSTVTFDVTFNVTSEGQPVAGAVVALEGYGKVTSDDAGVAIVKDVAPAEDIPYTVAADTYVEKNGSVLVNDQDISESVEMVLESYDVVLEITNGVLPLGNMTVVFDDYGTFTTDVFGTIIVEKVLPEDGVGYSITGEGYLPEEGTVDVVDHPIEKKIVMSPVTCNLSFEAVDTDGPIDNLSISCTMNDLDEAEDFIVLEMPEGFSTMGNGHWSVITDTMFQGEYCVKSARIYANQETILKLERTTRTGYIGFYYMVSSEKNNDVLTFEIDGQEVGRWSGEESWQYFQHKIDAGDHVFEWAYLKDGSNSAGEDCAWIDYVTYPSVDTVVKEVVTDANGEAKIYGVRPYNFMEFYGYSDVHEEYVQAISSVESDTTINILLDRVYNAQFKVSSDQPSGSIEVNGATVTLDSVVSQQTDYSGETLFERISKGAVSYTVMAEGYETYIGTIEVSNADVVEDVVVDLIPVFNCTNVVTPNGDGYNDYWEMYNVANYRSFLVEIFTTAGEKVFSTTDYENNKWDGKVDGSDLPDGVYYYLVTSPEDDMVFKGIINLLN